MSKLIRIEDAIDAILSVESYAKAINMETGEVKDLLNALPPAEEEKKMIREYARLVLEGVAKMCNERRNLLEFKCEGCSFLDWCVDISDSVTYEPWEWLAIEGVMEID